MATLKTPAPQPLKFVKNYEKLLRTAEQQAMRAREMREAARVMCDHAVEMRADRPYSFPWVRLNRTTKSE